MSNFKEKQGGAGEYPVRQLAESIQYRVWGTAVFASLARTRFRTFLSGVAVGFIVVSLFLVLSLKVADPALDYNPYRWLSKPHEWLMIVGLVLETELFLLVTKVRPTLNQVLLLFVIAHLVAGMLVYGVLVVVVREVVVRFRHTRAKRRA